MEKSGTVKICTKYVLYISTSCIPEYFIVIVNIYFILQGVGVNMNDPYENFRKNKGAAFVFRMRTRDEKS